MLSYLVFAYQWVLKRLPKTFSIPLVVLLVIYSAFVFPFLAVRVVPTFEVWIAQQIPTLPIPRPGFLQSDYSVIGGIVSALLILIIAVFGILVSYGVAATIYRMVRGKPMK